MDPSRLRRLLLLFAAAALLAGTAESDLEQEKTECAPKLVGLAPCLPYVGGESKAPTLDCCSGLKQVLDKSRKCLCLLIKDRDEDLGVKINISLAANLPGSCKSPVNVSDCVSLLQLKPNSTEAKKFDGLDEIIGKGANSSSTTTAAAPSAAGTYPLLFCTIKMGSFWLLMQTTRWSGSIGGERGQSNCRRRRW
ncbi:unnamed protein product [Linum tenue]|uniref:Bifunctional inhibitor/plant lipid transfer protein/seed storage helical domain-containing protein n=1 Tax=Linum tenue TaxID=586396 RepID=A0AAV0M369_9ROSI|nr:unnamed protein product [Linum tenue]